MHLTGKTAGGEAHALPQDTLRPVSTRAWTEYSSGVSSANCPTLKSSFSPPELHRLLGSQNKDGEKYFQQIFDKRFISKASKELLQLDNQKKTSHIKWGKEVENTLL